MANDRDLGFLAEPGDLADWRMVILVDNAARAGLLDLLPGTAEEAAAKAGMHPKSARVLLDALTVFGVVTVIDDGETVYRPGPAMPDGDQRAILAQHAQFIGRWASELPGRLPDPINRERRPWIRPGLAGWLASLGARAKGEAPGVIDRCLAAFPNARTVLDVAGGHGEYGIEAARRGLDVTLLDLPQVIDIVSEWPSVRETGIHLWAGDVFDSRPDATFDLVLAFGFTHTQPAGRIATLFPHLAALTNNGGGLAVNTFLRGSGPVARLFAVQMLIAGNDGDTHRLEDYVSWITAAGYDEPWLEDGDGRTLLLAKKSGTSVL
ncbi:MAG: class I SAM-dependent methyltransferase [Acidimicrobiia bacterium]|nr:class I SAM-dependent methyltransferase [Acidimicrobiia bacterium]